MMANLNVTMSDFATFGSRRHPDVVVEADEPDRLRVDEVEVGQRQDERGDHRAGREAATSPISHGPMKT